jgi:TrmH family RNA methyltransferase
MLSKAKIKYIRSLDLKKKRKEEGVFVAEGPKVVGDLLGHFRCRLLVALPAWFQAHPEARADELIEVSEEELTQASFLKHPQEVLALFEQRPADGSTDYPRHSLCLALDDVQDPGNLGTILRVADWFGIEHVYCSQGTVDAYSPKVVQATMGALARVQVHYGPLTELIASLGDTPVYGTFLDGRNMYHEELSECGLIVMGNEGNGISKELEQHISHKLYIPNYPTDRATSESLNVAMATGIICAEFRRRSGGFK